MFFLSLEFKYLLYILCKFVLVIFCSGGMYMYYISGTKMSRGKKLYLVTDTKDGVTDTVTLTDLKKGFEAGLQVQGFDGKTAKPVAAGRAVVGSMYDSVKEQLKGKVANWSYEECYNVAKKGGFVRKIKPYTDSPEELHAVTLENIFPESMSEVIDNAQQYTNTIQAVDTFNEEAVFNALRSNMCLILQLGSKGKLTSFIGTASLGVIDSIYGKSYFDIFYLTKNLIGYTYRINKVRTAPTAERKKNPSVHSIISGSLRFRKEGTHHDGDMLVLSTPLYSINMDTIVSVFILNNPARMGTYNVINEFKQRGGSGLYEFDSKMWKDVSSCLAGGTNYFKDKNKFLSYVDTESLTDKVDLTAVMDKFDKDFNYIVGLRQRMTTL